MPSPSSPADQSSSAATSAIIVAIVISSAIIASASIYLILRFLSNRCRRSPRTFSVADDVIVEQTCIDTTSLDLVSSLPSFMFGSVTGNLTNGDCAVCLSKFERTDVLRLLPLCCHAFHQSCVDTWLLSNLTCPLCRSTVRSTETDLLSKISQTANDITNSNSFRIEMGSISRRRTDSNDRRSYSVGEFDYVMNESNYEVPNELLNHHRQVLDDKEINNNRNNMDDLAAGVGGGRSWLRDYVDRLASISSRSSGRFFTGSSRRSEVVVAPEDIDGYRAGEEISEIFRWLSGV